MFNGQQSGKMWSGRFREPLDPEFEAWQRSIVFDWRLLDQEVAASKAHASALSAAGILSKAETTELRAALDASAALGTQAEGGAAFATLARNFSDDASAGKGGDLGWIAKGLLRPLDARLLLMHVWSMTQHYADYAVQVRVMLRLPPDAPIDRVPIERELTNFVLMGCGLAEPTAAPGVAPPLAPDLQAI